MTTTYILIGIIIFLLLYIIGSGIYNANVITEITIKYSHARLFIVKLGMWETYNDFCKREIEKARRVNDDTIGN
jgi:hypothetical protein